MGKGRGLKMSDVPRYEVLVKALKKYNAQAREEIDKRNVALLAVLTFTGCRIQEALNLTTKDLDFKHMVVRIKQQKKRREFYRFVPVPVSWFWGVMMNYIKAHPFKGETRLFNISQRQARDVVYSFSIKYLGRRIRPHAIRHSYATFILRKTRDLETARRLLGHSDYTVIKQYLEYSQEDLEEDLLSAFSEVI